MIPARLRPRAPARAGQLYVRATKWPHFATLVTAVFVVYALSGFVTVLTTILAAGVALGGKGIGIVSSSDLGFLHVATSCCYAISTTFGAPGRGRAAHRWPRRGPGARYFRSLRR